MKCQVSDFEVVSRTNGRFFFWLGDEISCDSCRLWDKESGKKMDKDRFSFGLGGD